MKRKQPKKVRCDQWKSKNINEKQLWTPCTKICLLLHYWPISSSYGTFRLLWLYGKFFPHSRKFNFQLWTTRGFASYVEFYLICSWASNWLERSCGRWFSSVFKLVQFFFTSTSVHFVKRPLQMWRAWSLAFCWVAAVKNERQTLLLELKSSPKWHFSCGRSIHFLQPRFYLLAIVQIYEASLFEINNGD